jgi:hypothetical protein
MSDTARSAAPKGQHPIRRRHLLALPALAPSCMAMAAQRRPVRVIVQGQSNALLFFDGEAAWRLEAAVRRLTGLGDLFAVTGMRSDFDHDAASLFAGTHTYSFEPARAGWLLPEGSPPGSPASWRDGPPMLSFMRFSSRVARSVPADALVALLRMHDEYDSTFAREDERAVYEAAEREFIARWRSSMGGRPAALLPVFFVPVPFAMGNSAESYRAIRSARERQIADAAHNAHHGVFSTLDAEHRGDGSHWTPEAANRVADRLAVRLARWLHDYGHSPNDLAWLPGQRPAIRSATRVGDGSAVELAIGHDRGTDLVVPDRPNLDDYVVEQDGPIPVRALSRTSATTLRLALARRLAPGRATFDYGLYQGYSGPDSQVTDNWHLSSDARMRVGVPRGVRMILSRASEALAIR